MRGPHSVVLLQKNKGPYNVPEGQVGLIADETTGQVQSQQADGTVHTLVPMIIKATTGDPSATGVATGTIVINTADTTVKILAAGAWKEITVAWS